MPKKITSIPAQYDSFTRPVAFRILEDVKTICNLSKDMPVLMTNEFDKVSQPGAAVGTDSESFWGGKSRIRAVIKESIRTEAILNQIVRQAEMPSVFEDPRLGVYVKPVYQYCNIEIDIKYTANSRGEAIRWRDDLVAKFAENLTTMTHEVEYNIPITDDVLNLLAHMHELRENVAGYGEPFEEYFKNIQRRKMVLLSTVDGDIDKTTIVVPEKQAQVQGWFAGNGIPTETKEEGNTNWVIDFTYVVMYHRATHWYMCSPLMVHQQHVRKPWFDDTPRFTVDELPKRAAIGIRALDVIGGNVDSFPPPADGMRVPTYDEWSPGYRNQPQYSVPGISWMIALDEKDPQDILNLTELPDFRFTKEMDTYFREYYDSLTKFGGAPVVFTLFSEDRPMSQEVLTVDSDLNVRATYPLDLRKSYHLRLSFPTLYGCFSNNAIRSMQMNWKPTLQIFQSILSSLDVEYAKSILLDEQYLPKSYIKWFYKLLEDKGIGFQDNTGGPGGPVNTGESGGLPGSGNNGGGTGGSGNGGNGGNGPGGDWGYQDPWSREGNGHIRYLQFLGIIALRK